MLVGFIVNHQEMLLNSIFNFAQYHLAFFDHHRHIDVYVCKLITINCSSDFKKNYSIFQPRPYVYQCGCVN